MHTREDLSKVFHEILESDNVYFQPPANIRMKYPAIRYSLSKLPTNPADNRNFIKRTMYEGVVIDPNPDSPYIHKILEIPGASFSDRAVVDSLYHDYFTIYY